MFATGLNEYGQCGIRINNNADDGGKGENDGSSSSNAKTTMNDIVRGWTRVEFRDATDGTSSLKSKGDIRRRVVTGGIARGGKRVFAFGKNDRGQLGVGDAFDGKEREEGRSLLSMNQQEREKKEEDFVIVDGGRERIDHSHQRKRGRVLQRKN